LDFRFVILDFSSRGLPAALSYQYSVSTVLTENKKSYWKRLREMLSAKNYSPHERALGAAVGVGVGLLPVSPFQIPVLALICIKLKCFRALAFVTVWVANPFTYVPIYAADYVIGSWILRISADNYIDFSNVTLKALFKAGPSICLSILLGGIILSVTSTLITYVFVRFIARKKK